MLQKYDRLSWVDLAKGMAVFLVVMHHSSIYERSIFSLGMDNDLIWSKVELVFYNIRMPLFFLISGFLASGIASRGKDQLKLRSALPLTYAYLLWSLILMQIAPNWPDEGIGQAIGWRPIADIAMGSTLAWYLWAIVLSFLLAWLMRRLPVPVALILSILLGVFLETHDHVLGGRFPTLGRLLPFYMIGIRCPEMVLTIVRRRKSRAIIVVLFAYIMLHRYFTSIWADYARDLLGLVIGLMTAAWAAKISPRLSAAIGWLGRRTLPVYVMHFPIVAILGGASVRALGSLSTAHPLAIVYTPALAAITVALCLAIHIGLLRMRCGWLFTMPRWKRAQVPITPRTADNPA
ncbi:acyltransferase family protein [Sphingobium phenoxybenzoativorans]|uniref:acyltransferase family protein n=1 Tax=Sphingobium phenoxybenzoativorans TaxID=1592790 RepID=UPI0008729921|nr:acyltransferase family protein [Sphingobium phenoxybenzoativorans]